MSAIEASMDEFSRLQAVRNRVRELAATRPAFAQELRDGFHAFLELADRFETITRAHYEHDRARAREVLVSGRLFDPDIASNGPVVEVSFEGLCPIEISQQHNTYPANGPFPASFERRMAQAALAAFDRDTIYQDRTRTKAERESMAAEYRGAIAAGTHVRFTWRIMLSPPADRQCLPDPQSLKRSDLELWSEADLRTIALYRLGGLADAGAIRPIVPTPPPTGDDRSDFAAHVAWRFRFPICGNDPDEDQPRLNVTALPADVAEQFLRHLENDRKQPAATPPFPPNEEPSGGPALTANQSRVLQTLARFDSARLLSADAIAAEMDEVGRLSPRTIGPIVLTLIELGLAERPEGKRSGVRLTPAGRRLAQKIAD